MVGMHVLNLEAWNCLSGITNTANCTQTGSVFDKKRSDSDLVKYIKYTSNNK